jgi:superfamily I DNA/RNA helicase
MFIGKQKPLLLKMWNKSNNREFTTFDSIRKQSLVNNWLTDIIDNKYDMILIDEAQDFDMIMLRMILRDTKIPKVFVGDPLQSIYKFRGSINAFEHLPMNASIIEFYSTFRIGNPACDIIRNTFEDCWIISKSVNNTNIIDEFDSNTKYTYLFRKWKTLYTVALSTKRIWINDYDNQFDKMIQMHKKLNKSYNTDDEIDDDLPKFLKSLSYQELEDMLLTIQENIVPEHECLVKFYIIHQYKGLETENIRIANDFCIPFTQEEKNLKYVALTRGMKNIVLDQCGFL